MLDRLTIERMRGWTGDKPVLIALSGGGDSVALLHLLIAEFGPECVRAAVVDHALREGSAQDALRAKDFAQALGVRADVLTLAWAEGANRGQQGAREARYRALCDYARTHGLNTIAAAHTADDQSETVLMRAGNGSKWRGLASIAPFSFAPLWPEGRGIALARPLLGVRRGALRDHLRARSARWIEDPANDNPKFERVRVRARLAALEAGGFDPMRLVHLAARLRRRSDTLDADALSLIRRAAHVDGAIFIDRAGWSGSAAVRTRALSVLIAAASGASREPAWSDVETLEVRVMGAGRRRTTHSGVEFTTTGSGASLAREAAAVLGRADGAPPHPPLPLTKNIEAVWDGRLAVTAQEEGWRVVPERNTELAAFENGSVHRRYADLAERILVRPLVAERIAHAFAPDINRAKP